MLTSSPPVTAPVHARLGTLTQSDIDSRVYQLYDE